MSRRRWDYCLVVGLFLSMVYVNMRWVLQTLSPPDPWYDAAAVVGRRLLVATDEEDKAVNAVEQRVAESFEFSQPKGSGGAGKVRLRFPDSVQDSTLHYPPWAHRSSLFIPWGILSSPAKRCAALAGPSLDGFHSVVLDAGWWELGDMFQPRADIFGDTQRSSCLLCALQTACGVPVRSLPVLLWTSALVPTTDRRFQHAATQGYFIHSGERSGPAPTAGADDTRPYAPLRFVWRRAAAGADGRALHIDGALIDFSSSKAVHYFGAGADGIGGLVDRFEDVYGFRLGGVDALLRGVHHQRTRILGARGHVEAEGYSHDYYEAMMDLSRRLTTRLNAWNQKRFARGEVAARPPPRDLVIFARAVDSHNAQHFFHAFAPPDAVHMPFVGDHAFSFTDLRESALNLIHSTYRCYMSLGTLVGSAFAATTGAEELQAAVAHTTPPDAESTTAGPCAPNAATALRRQWLGFAMMLPGLYLSAEVLPLTVDERRRAADHDALAPYFAAAAARSFMFEVKALHVPTDVHRAFQQYQNPTGNPFCPVRYVPAALHHVFTAVKDPQNGTVTYGRNAHISRAHIPHVVYEAPMDDYQFVVGPHLLAVPRLTLAGSPRRITLPPLPSLSGAMRGMSDTNQWVDANDPFRPQGTPLAGLTATVDPPPEGLLLLRRGALLPLLFAETVVFAVDAPLQGETSAALPHTARDWGGCNATVRTTISVDGADANKGGMSFIVSYAPSAASVRDEEQRHARTVTAAAISIAVEPNTPLPSACMCDVGGGPVPVPCEEISSGPSTEGDCTGGIAARHRPQPLPASTPPQPVRCQRLVAAKVGCRRLQIIAPTAAPMTCECLATRA